MCSMATVRIPQSMAEQIDRLRGDVPRDRFVRRMLEKALENPQAKGGTPERRLPTGDSAPASVPSRASARGVAERGSDARTASFRSASSARKVPAGPQASPPSDVSSSASQGREDEAGVNGGAGAAQTTVDEMLASCPNCATTLEPAELEDQTPVLVCPDCGYAREPS
jgi:DNA-directed RNA polymerase subunit RPC12/RpoP/Arc/MetJ-type ribon-helix-helix transcriptional regulator